MSGKILHTNLSDVKNSFKHTTYKSKNNSKITQRQTPDELIACSSSTINFPLLIFRRLWFLSLIQLTSITFVWYSYLLKQVDMARKYYQLVIKKNKNKNWEQNNTINGHCKFFPFFFHPNGCIFSFHSFNKKITTQ